MLSKLKKYLHMLSASQRKIISSEGTGRIAKWTKYLVIGLGVLCLLLGLVGRVSLWGSSFEWDEVFTVVSTNPALSFIYLWKNFLIVDVHPPLYNFLLWIYNHLVPYGPEWALRLPSIVCSISALIYAWVKFPRRFGKSARWIFVLLISCNAWLLFFSQYARAYSFMFLLAMILTFYFLDMSYALYTRRDISTKQWVLYGVLSLFLCWSHYFGALLFGLFSVSLFINALFHKRSLKMFILVPLGVFVLFLPWLIPNLLYNVHAERFGGNWWANERALNHASLYLWFEFMFGFRSSMYMLATLTGSALGWQLIKVLRKKPFDFWRDILWLGLIVGVACISVWFISHKIYWFIGRYFVPFMPSIYMLVALLIAPLARRTHKIVLLVFFFYVGSNFYAYYTDVHVHVQKGHWWAVRQAMQWYQKYFPDKELFVVSLDAFPKNSLVPMYSFYPNHVLGMKRRVTELYYATVQEREQALSHQETAIVWMPNCDPRKLKRLARKWNRKIMVYHQKQYNCFFVVGTKPEKKGEQVLKMYRHRLDKMTKQEAQAKSS